MLTKYHLHYADTDYELQDDDLYNWDDIRCSYKRGDYDGVVRSFTSQFVFVNKAREILLDLYLKRRFAAEATLSIHTINNRLEYVRQYECPLDFSTVTWDAHTFSINAIDNSLAAMIKSGKGTKYELSVGGDIESDTSFRFDRLPIMESVTYEITEGDSLDDGSLVVPAPVNDRIFCGLVNDEEIYIGGVMDWTEDQAKETGGHMVKAVKPVDVVVEFNIVCIRCEQTAVSYPKWMNLRFEILRADGTTETVYFGDDSEFPIGSNSKVFCGEYASEEALREAWAYSDIDIDGTAQTQLWAVVNGSVWTVVEYASHGKTDWVNQEVSPEVFTRTTYQGKTTVHLEQWDRIALKASGTGAHVFSSNIRFGWFARGESCTVPAFSPVTVAEKLLSRITGGRINPRVVISEHDPRVARTVVMAAESIRGLDGAKLYSSFSEFCDWMSAVYGYVYYLGGECGSGYTDHRQALGGCTSNTLPITETPWGEDYLPEPKDIMYFEHYGRFVAYDGTEYFGNFPGDEYYNDPVTGHPRIDTLYTLRRFRDGVMTTRLYYFKAGDYAPYEYRGDVTDIGKTFQMVHFVHRTELFRSDATIRHIAHCRELKYGVDTSAIYSTVTAGYEKKDYENVNGRDEFNFSNTYSTGCTVSDKTLSLISKYRADCYGMEFAAQKRGASTTDSSSDKDVFFVLCRNARESPMQPDRTHKVTNAVSDEVFNGGVNPIECIRANAGYIGLQAEDVTLAFASSTGNSEIKVGGVPMTSDLELEVPFATCGWVEFSTDDVDDIADTDELVEVVDNGVTYRGFLMETDIRYARTETAKYKLIIKDIEI